MDYTGILRDFVSQLGRVSGLPGLGLNESGHAAVSFNRAVTIHFQARSEDILFYAGLGDLPEDAQLEAACHLLQANFLWKETNGATLSLTLEGEIVLSQILVPDGEIDFPAFQERFAAFARTAAHWRERVLSLSEPRASEEPADPAEGDGTMPSFAMRI